MTMRRAEVGEAIALERSELERDLAAIDPEHWDEPSLCTGWSIRDVVGHLVYLDRSYAHPRRFVLERSGTAEA